MSGDELVELKFRLADGSDIGPSKYDCGASVTSLKEKIIAQWPKGFAYFFFIARISLCFVLMLKL